MSTFLSSQIHLKNIRIEKWFTISGGKKLIFLFSTDTITSNYHCIAVSLCGDQGVYLNRTKMLQSRVKYRMRSTYNGAVQITPAQMFNPKRRKIFQIGSLKLNAVLPFKWLFRHQISYTLRAGRMIRDSQKNHSHSLKLWLVF